MKKRHVAAYKKTFPEYLTVDDIGQALERLNVRQGVGNSLFSVFLDGEIRNNPEGHRGMLLVRVTEKLFSI